MYDILSFFKDYDIDFLTSGKNVSSGWVEINCPFCHDPSYHMGINIESSLSHCWVCGKKSNFEALVSELQGISYYEAERLLKNYPLKRIETPDIIKIVSHISLEEFTTIPPDPHTEYLQKRGFDVEELKRKYSIRFCYTTGRFPYRIIVPVIMNGTIVNMVVRDITGLQEPKYKGLPNSEAIIPMKSCLYNIDSVKKKAVIVEGIFDCWRMGNGSIATFGTEYTSAQLETIRNKELEKVFVMFDSDASKKAEKIANALSSFVSTEILFLEKGDPADMKKEQVLQLRAELFL